MSNTPKNRRPLNKNVIIYNTDGVNSGPFGRGEYVSITNIREVCTRENCPNTDEHLAFDGQIFYKSFLKRMIK